MKLSKRQIIEKASEYELSHPIEDYRIYDWNVWPLIRESATLTTMSPAFRSKNENFFSRNRLSDLLLGLIRTMTFIEKPIQYLIWVRAIIKQYFGKEKRRSNFSFTLSQDASHHDSHLSEERDVLILTTSNRRVKTENGYYEIYADPLVEKLDQLAVTSLIWELGTEKFPRMNRSAWITKWIESEFDQMAILPPIPKPEWFFDFTQFTKEISGVARTWLEVETEIRQVQRLSLVFEKWLRVVRPKVLVTVVWYGARSAAAILAARRLGIPSIDLQHGHLVNHDAYEGWDKITATPYEIMPNIFHCWGIRQRLHIQKWSAAFNRHAKMVAAGNQWLNKWIYSDCSVLDPELPALKKKTKGYKKIIIVTFQVLDEFNDLVVQAMSQSPTDWFWLLRFHPGTTAALRSEFGATLQNLKYSNFEFEITSKMPLYSLLLFSDVLITGYSTTALEALAFGKPTILITEDGANDYKEFIDAQVMIYANTASKIIEAISQSDKITASHCKEVSKEYFEDQQGEDRGIREWLKIAGITPSR